VKLRAVIFAAFLLVGFAGTRSLIAYQAPQPSPQQAAIAQALDQRGIGQAPDNPAPAVAPRRLRGARRSDPHKVLMAPRHRARAGIPTTYPPAVGYKLDIWGNDTYGDCVSAEEAAKLSIYSVNAGFPGVFVDPQTLIKWARQHGYLNGADLSTVMDSMIKDGIQATDGKTYHDGPYESVDWKDDASLSSAIYTGPVKIAVSANQLERSVSGQNGWIATGYRRDPFTDHCVSLVGYGTMQELCSLMGVSLPQGVGPTTRSYLLFTWGTIGIIDQASMVNITDEAWVRHPATAEQPAPVNPPTPAPNPSPNPAPGPNPGPSGMAYTLVSAPSGAAIDRGNGVFTWAIPRARRFA